MKSATTHDLEAVLRVSDPGFRGCDMRGLHDLRRFSSQTQGDYSPWSYFYDSLTEGGVLSPDGESFASNYAVSLFPAEKTGVFGPESFRVIKRASVAVYQQPARIQNCLRACPTALSFPRNLPPRKSGCELSLKDGSLVSSSRKI